MVVAQISWSKTTTVFRFRRSLLGTAEFSEADTKLFGETAHELPAFWFDIIGVSNLQVLNFKGFGGLEWSQGVSPSVFPLPDAR